RVLAEDVMTMRVILTMRVIVTMGVIVVMAMIMIVIVAMVMARVMAKGQKRLIFLVRLEQLLHRYLPVDGLGVREDVLDHLVLEDWSAQLEQCRGVLLIILIDQLLLAWITPRLLDKRAAELLLGHLDLGLGADLPDQQAKAHSPFGNLAVLGLQRRLVLTLIGQAFVRPVEPLLQLRPDGIELGFHQRLRKREVVRRVERIEDLAL